VYINRGPIPPFSMFVWGGVLIRVNPTAVELIRNKPALGPQNGKWLKRASFIPMCECAPFYSRRVQNMAKKRFRINYGWTRRPEVNLTLTLNLRLPQRENWSHRNISEIPLVDPTVGPKVNPRKRSK